MPTKKRYHRHIGEIRKRGLCATCWKNPIVEGHTKCQRCLDNNKKWARKTKFWLQKKHKKKQNERRKKWVKNTKKGKEFVKKQSRKRGGTQSLRDDERKKCEICDGENYKIYGHHVDFGKNNNNRDNLIAVCYKCHTATHHLHTLTEEQIEKLIKLSK